MYTFGGILTPVFQGFPLNTEKRGSLFGIAFERHKDHSGIATCFEWATKIQMVVGTSFEEALHNTLKMNKLFELSNPSFCKRPFKLFWLQDRLSTSVVR